MSEHQHADQVLSVRDLTKSFRVSGGKTLRALDGSTWTSPAVRHWAWSANPGAASRRWPAL